ncbi:AzlD domain-containing protein [Aquincola tertiaricarbonis]|uniref:AzlD domain-containing protein n=1 Tax=Aquincola tertiaricarbonis TaxID=391953 RepID=A0ABY4SDN6_AQUTE|nr:AzlD domain-containing protein [Aquincola tertiaricarbonis]URI09843.1 AzlD domain-containing protein [Aquincola tertiaricarbonis]
MSTWETILTIIGLGAITVITRSFFLFPDKEVPIPAWLREGLRYAPLAAMAAVVVPELLITQGELIHTWRDARVFGALAGALYFWWRRGMLGTIVVGTAVMLALRFVLGW